MTPPALAIENLSLRLGGFALRHLDLRVEAGEILVLLGPNGAGKSLTLETIAGFHRPDAGRIAISGREVTLLPPERRNIALMFQDFGLFPHLNVAENLAVGLHGRRRARRRDIAELLARFGIGHLARRMPTALSAGERQRVALARALAAAPDLYLFDEPFSALDGQTRQRLCGELGEFLRGSGVAAVFVGHDLGEARRLADRIAVLRAGGIVQAGSAASVLRRPADRFVAEFVGFENILRGRVQGRCIALGRGRIAVPARQFANEAPREVWLCIRAEDIDLEPDDRDAGGDGRFTARVVRLRDEGAVTRLTLDCGFPLEVCAMTRRVRELGLGPGSEIAAVVPPPAAHLLPAEGPDRGD